MPQTRISSHGHEILRRLSKESGLTSEQVLDRALDLLQRQRMLESVNTGYAALRADAKAWSAEESERALWDRTLTDGGD